MKTVFTNRQLGHVWAQQTQERGKSSNGQFFFNGPSIYSYGHHFCIAKFATTLQGQEVVLVTNRGYSVTTSKHIGYTRQAIPGHYPRFYVHKPDDLMEHNIERLIKDAEYTLEQANKPRKQQKTKDAAVTAMLSAIEQANELGRLFIKDYQPIALPQDASFTALAAGVAEREAERLEAERLKAEKRKKERQAEALATFKRLYGAPSQFLDKWRGNEIGDAWHALRLLSDMNEAVLKRAKLSNEFQYMRVKGDLVETSTGAEFPVSHAKKAWPVVKRILDSGQSWQRNGKTIHLGHFQIDSIEAGVIKAGCHRIQASECRLLATQLGMEA